MRFGVESLTRHGSVVRLAGFAALVASGLMAVTALGAGGTISTVAGTGSGGYSGDGAAATVKDIYEPRDAVSTSDGGFLIADTKNNRIRKVASDGTISTVAGSADSGYAGDGGAAVSATLKEPSAVALTPDGGFLIADTNNHVIRRVSPGGTITTLAGTGSSGFSGDGGPATAAQLKNPYDVASLPDGGVLIADHDNHRIRKVNSAGTISTVAGTGSGGFNGDGITAATAHLNEPHDVAPLAEGGYLIADAKNHRVRRVTPGGLISTVAGTGSSGYSGDGGLALSASLDEPNGITPTALGGFLISDHRNAAVRYVSPAGLISTLAGTGTPGFSGDGGPASASALDLPEHLSLTSEGDVLVADSGNHRIRRIDADLPLLDLFPGVVPPVVIPPILSPPNGPAPAPSHDDGSNPNTSAPGSGGSGSGQLEPADAPQVGRDLNAQRERGTILVKVPGSPRFVALDRPASLPMGSLVDATRGAVKLTSARNHRGRTQRAVFSQGAFKVVQKRTARPTTDLLLRGGTFSGCTRKRKKGAEGSPATAAGRGARRRLWGRGHGRFRTRGRHGAATVRGTIWLTQDGCNGTLIRVRRGKVAVRDHAKKRTVLVRAGKSYLARN